jgi:hypothetical protein
VSIAYRDAALDAPELTKDEIIELLSPEYPTTRTKQAFKDSTDINKIMDKARKTGVITHVGKYGDEYGDYSDIPDLLDAELRLIRAREIFEDAPGEIRREFSNDVGKFFAWVNDPANADKVAEKLTDVARRGDQLPVVRGKGPVGAVSEPVASVSSDPVPSVPVADSTPPEASEA